MERRGRGRDEDYVIDLCDRVLGQMATRQKRFDFLLGDPGKTGRRARLPVDAFYERFQIVIEYREIQHVRPNKFMDRRLTCSGCHRGEQRKLYDQRRRDVLPSHGIRLIELEYSLFGHDGHARLKRDLLSDEAVIVAMLSEFLVGT